jgi:hypothetical protein
MIRTFCTLSIKFYQKFISPHKGFVCACNVLHKNGSCSKHIMDIVKTRPILHWNQLIRQQFSVCKQANTTLINERKKDKNNRCSDFSCDALDCGFDACT